MAAHVVVTGTGGFVGGYVARWLAGRGLEVTAHTRQKADLCTRGSLPRRFDALIHCAAETPERCPEPARLYERNMDLARSVFEQALAAGAQSVVFLSSMSAYGAVSVSELTEDTPPGELDPYGRAKRDSEALLKSCVGRGLRSALAIRLPGTVGKDSHDNFLSVALGRILRGEPVTGRNPDAFFNNIVYVGDLAAFLGDWIAAPRPGYAVTNLAASEPLPMREVFALMYQRAGREPGFTFEVGGKKPFLISLERARSLGYRPATVRRSLESFVRDCV
jgi:nucleoside-diphosphate-sugar epimerase